MTIDWASMLVPQIHPLEAVLRAVCVYVFLLVAFRLAGRKELGRYSNFDIALLFLVSVAMRETLVRGDESLTTAFLSFTTLLVVNRAFTIVSFHVPRAANLIQGRRRPLIRDGAIVEAELKRNRITHENLIAQLRNSAQIDSLQRVKDAWLERDGTITFSVEHATDARNTAAPAPP